MAALAVYFSIIFPKYSRSVTIERFDEFKKRWGNLRLVESGMESLADFLNDQIGDAVFDEEEIN